MSPRSKKRSRQSTSIEKLLSEQTLVILEAVDERLDKKFGEVAVHLDKVMKELHAHREEDMTGANQLRRHEDQLRSHEARINALERR